MLPSALQDRELKKFDLNEDGDVIVRTSVAGTIKVSGLNVAGRVTEVTLVDFEWRALPVSALANRNALAIQNVSGSEIKLNYDPLVTGYVGIAMPNGRERTYDISQNIVLYGKSQSGSVVINVEEIS